jgi:hypothetical protein
LRDAIVRQGIDYEGFFHRDFSFQSTLSCCLSGKNNSLQIPATGSNPIALGWHDLVVRRNGKSTSDFTNPRILSHSALGATGAARAEIGAQKIVQFVDFPQARSTI